MSAQSWAQAASGPSVTYVTLCEVLLASEQIRIHSGVGPLVWNGLEWLGVGYLGQVSPLSGGVDMEVEEVELTLSGIASAHRNEVLDKLTRGRRVNLYHGFWDSAGGAWAHNPELSFAGFVSHAIVSDQIDEAGIGQVSVSCNVLSAFAYARRRTIARRTDAHQQRLFAGDEFYAFKTDISKPVPQPAAGSSGNPWRHVWDGDFFGHLFG